ncbi:MAG: hypothetical protein M3Q66_10380 [Chloroflexota bacterium]|nr:hypothetical protein [Chloroflexota bacterium]
MPFPFLPGGGILAIAVLVGALAIFGLAIVAVDRAAGRAVGALRGGMLPGIVAGWHGWSPHPGSPDSPQPASPPSRAAIEVVDLD